MTLLDMADARFQLVGVAAPEVRISIDDSRADGVRGLVKRYLEFVGMDS